MAPQQGAQLPVTLHLLDSEHWVSIEPLTMYRDYIRDYTGVIEGIYWGYLGIMEKNMETTMP